MLLWRRQSWRKGEATAGRDRSEELRGEWDDYGRPSVMKQETFDENFQSVVSGETTPTQLRKNLGMTHSTFYRYRKTFYEK